MAYSQVPVRTSSDPNSSADINQLTDNIVAVKAGTTNFTKIVLDDSAGVTGITANGGFLYYNGDQLSTAGANYSFIFDGSTPFTLITMTNVASTGAGIWATGSDLYYNSTKMTSPAINALSDVGLASTICTGEGLAYDGSQWTNKKIRQISMFSAGVLAVEDNFLMVKIGKGFVIDGDVTLSLSVAPANASALFEVMYATASQTTWVTWGTCAIVATAKTSVLKQFGDKNIADKAHIAINVTQIGTGTLGSNLMVGIS